MLGFLNEDFAKVGHVHIWWNTCWYISMIGWRGTNPCILQLSYRSTSKPRVSWTVRVEGCTSTLNIELIFPPQAHSDISDTTPDYQRTFAIYRIIGPFSFTQRSILPFHLFHQNWQPDRLWWSTLQGRKRAFRIKLMGSSGKSKRDLHAQPFPTSVSKNCCVEENLLTTCTHQMDCRGPKYSNTTLRLLCLFEGFWDRDEPRGNWMLRCEYDS